MTVSPDISVQKSAPGAAFPAAAALTRTLLAVDDEPQILDTLAGVFSGSYRVVQATSGAEALALLRDGLRPQVILSDNRMPDLAGVDFLLQSVAYAPDAVRAVMTAYSDLREIMAAISRGHIYLYLTKPWQVVELVQAVRLCFQHHDLQSEMRQLSEGVEAQAALLQGFQRDLAAANRGYVDQNRTLLSQLVQTSRAFGPLLSGEGDHHVPHADFVARLSRAVAYVAGFSEGAIADIEIAAYLHDLGKRGLPRSVRAADPETLQGEERALYESHVERGARLLEGIPRFAGVAGIVARHHERPDGRGFPRRLTGRDICRESQIVSLADLYHNRAYRLTPDEARRRREGGRIALSEPERETRLAAAAAQFAEVEKLYDPRVVQAFHAVSAAGTIEGFRLSVFPS